MVSGQMQHFPILIDLVKKCQIAVEQGARRTLPTLGG